MTKERKCKVNQTNFELVKKLQDSGVQPKVIREATGLSQTTQWTMKQGETLEDYFQCIKEKKRAKRTEESVQLKDNNKFVDRVTADPQIYTQPIEKEILQALKDINKSLQDINTSLRVWE